MTITMRLERLRSRLLPSRADERFCAPFWSLLYLGFLFLNWGGYRPYFWLPVTLLSIVIFLTMYFHAYGQSGRRMLFHVVAIAALGFALTPFNSGASAYLIYASAMLPFSGLAMRKLIAIIVAGLASYAIELALLHWQSQYYAIAVTSLVVVAIFLANHFQREKHLRQAELKLSHDEVRRLAALAERERIGRDLHDLLGHTLSLVALKSELAGKLLDRDPGAARREIAEVERVARDALGQVRSAVTGIRAAGLAGELASARLLLESAGVHFDYHGNDRDLDAAIETCMAMALREAATNIQRHARATSAEVEITHGDGRVTMLVRDDGRGGIGTHGNGLSGMRERIEALGGTLSIESSRAHGTQLRIALPVASANVARSRGQSDAPNDEAAPFIATGLRHA